MNSSREMRGQLTTEAKFTAGTKLLKYRQNSTDDEVGAGVWGSPGDFTKHNLTSGL